MKISSLRLSLLLCAFAGILLLFPRASAQGPQLDYSRFLHSSQRHSSIACNSCHERTDNSATPRFPGHKACTDCHRGQFTTPWLAGMKASVRSASVRTTPRYGVASVWPL